MKEKLTKAMSKIELTNTEELVSCIGNNIKQISYNATRGSWVITYKKHGLKKDTVSSKDLEDFLINV
jgi:hypothetical protein